MDRNTVRSMLQAHFWANRQLMDTLDTLTPQQFDQPLVSSFPTIRETVAHIVDGEAFFLTMVLQEQQPSVRPAELQTPAEVRTRWLAIEQRWQRWLDELPAEGLHDLITVTFSGRAFALPAWQWVHQMIVHTPYHRGQVITLLRQVGATGVQTDPILFHMEQTLRPN